MIICTALRFLTVNIFLALACFTVTAPLTSGFPLCACECVSLSTPSAWLAFGVRVEFSLLGCTRSCLSVGFFCRLGLPVFFSLRAVFLCCSSPVVAVRGRLALTCTCSHFIFVFFSRDLVLGSRDSYNYSGLSFRLCSNPRIAIVRSQDRCFPLLLTACISI